MKALNSAVLTEASGPRRRIYDALLADPTRDWTVSQLACVLPDVSVEAVRTTVHLLMGDRLMDIVPHNRSLTVRLTTQGRETVAAIVAQRAAAGLTTPAKES